MCLGFLAIFALCNEETVPPQPHPCGGPGYVCASPFFTFFFWGVFIRNFFRQHHAPKAKRVSSPLSGCHYVQSVPNSMYSPPSIFPNLSKER